MALHGDREDNRVVDNMDRSKQKLCITAQPSGCLSMSCSTFGAIKSGIRMSVNLGKAEQHRHGTGLERETVAAEAGGSALSGCGDPGLSRASHGQAAGQGSWSAAEVGTTSLLSCLAPWWGSRQTGEQWQQRSEISKPGLHVECG